MRKSVMLMTVVSSAPAAMRGDMYRNARWAVRGLGSELLTNVVGRGGTSWQRAFRGTRAPENGNGTLAILTGATGGIGVEVAKGLSSSGYYVVVAARDRRRGLELVKCLRASGGLAEYVELHADEPESCAAFVRALRGRSVGLLINNAGVMSVSKREIMRTNFLGPAVLTLAILPSLRRHPSPRLVNVGSSSHLRAGRADGRLLERTDDDVDLTAYAQSKLALMQFSALLRPLLPWLTVVDAHPGIVWTPMLQRHWGALAPWLERSGVARLLFKSPECGAATILAAALSPRVPPPEWGERSRWRRGWRTQPYFVNQR